MAQVQPVVMDMSCSMSHYSVAVMNTGTDLKEILGHGQYIDMLPIL